MLAVRPALLSFLFVFLRGASGVRKLDYAGLRFVSRRAYAVSLVAAGIVALSAYVISCADIPVAIIAAGVWGFIGVARIRDVLKLEQLRRAGLLDRR